MSKDTNVELILDVIRCARTARTEVDLEEATLLAIALGDVSGKTGEMVRDIRTRIINEAAPNDGPFRAYLIGDLRVVEEGLPTITDYEQLRVQHTDAIDALKANRLWIEHRDGCEFCKRRMACPRGSHLEGTARAKMRSALGPEGGEAR